MLLKKAAGIAKGANNPSKEEVGKVTRQQALEIAKQKLQDLNAVDIDGAYRIIEGTAKRMGIRIVES